MVSFTKENSETSGMTDKRFVLDTNAVIFLTSRGSIISPGFLDELNKADLFISGISEIELFSKSAMPPDEENKLRIFISDRIPVIDLTEAVKKETITLRRKTKLKLPDCIIAATAIAINAVLLTADKKLFDLSWPGLRVQRLAN